MGGGDDPGINPPRLRGPYCPELSLLQKAQQRHLALRRKLGHLIEEQRAAMRRGQEAGRSRDRTRECPALVSEQLAQQQLTGKRAGVHGLQRAVLAPAQPVDRSGDQLLSGP